MHFDSAGRGIGSFPASVSLCRLYCGNAGGQDTWQQILGSRYELTKVTLFRDAIQSACGFAQAATGPAPERAAAAISWSWTVLRWWSSCMTPL